MQEIEDLLKPSRLWSYQEIFSKPCPIPKQAGIYAWYFKEVPPRVPVSGCVTCEDYTLLYAGISPKAPPKNGARPSAQTIHNRIRYHYRGNAEGSTLRLTLGCLLSEKLGLQLRRVGSGKRMTFNNGEKRLSEWMVKNAYIVWLNHPNPWIIEEIMIKELSLPLNLDQNQHHPFYAELKSVRSTAKALARELPIL